MEPMKTLVDEIRGIVGEARTRGIYPAETDAACDLLGNECEGASAEADLFTKMEERIEREYMPLPMLEGEPLKVGDKVDGYSQEGAEVVAIMNEKMVVVRANVKRGHGYHDEAYPLLLWCVDDLKRHEHTDTLERIEEDAVEELWHYWVCSGARCADCPALIEGKTPKDHYHTDSCEEAQVLDLLRRQRLVLERGQA